jgi:hypothetical protein
MSGLQWLLAQRRSGSRLCLLRFQRTFPPISDRSAIAYIQQCVGLFTKAINAPEDAEYVINLDAVPDAVGALEKPAFYYAEESQQNKFEWNACGHIIDVLGRFCYCSSCGTRNDLQDLESRIIPNLRNRINAGDSYEACAKDAVGAFDSFVSQYMKQLLRHIPMTPARRKRFERMRFHDLRLVSADLKNAFDIDIFEGIPSADQDFAALMFHRRHVYEHNGGEADAKYLADSGDSNVRLKQALRESQESTHRILNVVGGVAANLHKGFHEIVVPEAAPIKFRERQRRAESVATRR